LNTSDANRPRARCGIPDYSYVIFWGQGIVNGRTSVFWGDWGPTYIPPPQGEADSCFHTHVSYGVWGYANVWNLFGANYKQWQFLGGGGMSGMRDANGKCVHHADNPLKNTDARFGWGNDVTTINLRPPCVFIFCTLYYDYIVLGVLNNTSAPKRESPAIAKTAHRLTGISTIVPTVRCGHLVNAARSP
jgi:hypothetical protein